MKVDGGVDRAVYKTPAPLIRRRTKATCLASIHLVETNEEQKTRSPMATPIASWLVLYKLSSQKGIIINNTSRN